MSPSLATNEYMCETNQKRLTHLERCLKFHLVIYMLRLSCVYFEPSTPLTFSFLLPWVSTLCAIIIGSYIYIKLSLFAWPPRHNDVASQRRIHHMVQVAGSLESAVVLFTLVIVHEYEHELELRLGSSMAILVLLSYVYYQILRSLSPAIIIFGAYYVLFWWSCARDSNRCGPLMVLSLFLITIAIYTVTSVLKQEREDYLHKWNLDHDKSLYESFLKVLHDPILILEHGRLLMVNSCCDNKLQITAENYEMKLRAFVTTCGETLLRNATVALMASQEAVVQEADYKYKDEAGNCTRIFRVHIFRSIYKAAQKTVAIIFHDLTEEKEAEERKAQSRYQGLMYHSVSHELRTPLNGIKGLLSLAKGTAGTAARKVIAEAKAWCATLSNEIANILDYTQISLKDFALHPLRTDLRGLLRRLVKHVSLVLDDKRHRVNINLVLSPTLPPLIVLDTLRLDQVLLNVLSSAVKRVESGEIVMECRLSEDNRMLEFEVADKGQEMDPQLLTTMKSGTRSCNELVSDVASLKMTVTQLIVRQMGGQLEVISVPREGTHTIISVPYQISSAIVPRSDFETSRKANIPSEADWAAEMEEQVPASASKGESWQRLAYFGRLKAARISRPMCNKSSRAAGSHSNSENRRSQSDAVDLHLLVVDDVELNRIILVKMLAKFGWVVNTATNGEEAVQTALQLMKGNSRLLIFMDIDMPIMNGIEAAHRIREVHTLRRPFIVATTAYTAESVRRECMDAGMDHFIPKPITYANIKQVFALLSESSL